MKIRSGTESFFLCFLLPLSFLSTCSPYLPARLPRLSIRAQICKPRGDTHHGLTWSLPFSAQRFNLVLRFVVPCCFHPNVLLQSLLIPILEDTLPPTAFTYSQLIKTLLSFHSLSWLSALLPHFPNITTDFGSLLLVLLPYCVSIFSLSETLYYSLLGRNFSKS